MDDEKSIKLTDKELVEVLSRLLFESASLIRDLIFSNKDIGLYLTRTDDLLGAIDHYTRSANDGQQGI
jgi:hypothetical protein